MHTLQVEKAEAAITEEDASSMMRKMLSNKFDLDDFLNQYKSINKMGSLGTVMQMIPGMSNIDEKDLIKVEKKYAVYESLLSSMTSAERKKPELLAKSASRRRRIAKGAGRKEGEVNELLATFAGMRVQMKTMSKMMAQSGGVGVCLLYTSPSPRD